MIPSLGRLARLAWWHLPSPVRTIVRSSPFLNRARGALREALPISHDELYDEKYYEFVDEVASTSTDAMADSIVGEYHPSSVLDVGCGTGTLLVSLRARGVPGIGLEYSRAALRVCLRRGLDVRRFDLERDRLPPLGRFDVVISTEVAEHLPASCADRYVDVLCAAADVVVFTAATPGQGGHDHVNEQPHDYWMAKFRARGFSFQEQRSLQWRAVWDARQTQSWYHRNLMLFHRR
jgi:SAM-dependent methyltransferase